MNVEQMGFNFAGLMAVIDNGINKELAPTTEEIEAVFTLIDRFHEKGFHKVAHKLDVKMCEWCGLLLDA